MSFQSNDEMYKIKENLKKKYGVKWFSFVFVIKEVTPMYNCLKEYYVKDAHDNVSKVLTLRQPMHVIVCDMDETLITSEENVRLRDPFIYDSLSELKKMGVFLFLWSYGDEAHVEDSLTKLNLKKYFDIIICRGYKIDKTDIKPKYYRQNKSKKTSFLVDPNVSEKLPKSPKIVLYYLEQAGITKIKSLILVDDLFENNIGYDYFVHVHRSVTPKKDWEHYHKVIINYINKIY